MTEWRSTSAIGALAGALTGVIFVAVSCGPVRDEILVRYSTRQIDRPFALPKGLATWKISSESSVERKGTKWDANFGLPSALFWSYAVRDSVTLLFAPLPWGAQAQVLRDEKNLAALIAHLGTVGYSTYDGWILGPNVGTYFRRRLTENSAFAIRSSFSYTHRTRYRAGNRDDLWAQVSIGPFFQLSDRWAVGPNATAGYRRFFARSILGAERNDASRFEFPLGVWSSWSLSRLWDLNADYEYSGPGSRSDFEQHTVSLVVTWYWCWCKR
ncbi:MAG: hypothetical protein HYT87_13640 [Nitrospirae bacterium]|nr:hypothetical protein [Nitrospirota bacterium]